MIPGDKEGLLALRDVSSKGVIQFFSIFAMYNFGMGS